MPSLPARPPFMFKWGTFRFARTLTAYERPAFAPFGRLRKHRGRSLSPKTDTRERNLLLSLPVRFHNQYLRPQRAATGLLLCLPKKTATQRQLGVSLFDYCVLPLRRPQRKVLERSVHSVVQPGDSSAEIKGSLASSGQPKTVPCPCCEKVHVLFPRIPFYQWQRSLT